MHIKEILGIELPIIQAPMAGVQGSALAIAVARAGGLGSLPCAMLSQDATLRELETLRTTVGNSFNVNFFCHQPASPDIEREIAWRTRLKHYYEEMKLDFEAIPAGPVRHPFSDAIADLVEPFKPAVVSFHFGLPEDRLVRRIKSWGSRILSSATTVSEAVWLESHGADAIIAQGAEAGGHRAMFLSDDTTTQIGTFALVPQVVRAVRVPVIAAGGIADARGVRSILELGASAAQIGSAYLLCPEATTSPVHRAALQSDARTHTAITNLFTGKPARSIVNRLMRELGPMSLSVPVFPTAGAALTPLRARAEESGSGDFSPLWCGQNSSGCRDIGAEVLTLSFAYDRS